MLCSEFHSPSLPNQKNVGWHWIIWLVVHWLAKTKFPVFVSGCVYVLIFLSAASNMKFVNEIDLPCTECCSKTVCCNDTSKQQTHNVQKCTDYQLNHSVCSVSLVTVLLGQFQIIYQCYFLRLISTQNTFNLFACLIWHLGPSRSPRYYWDNWKAWTEGKPRTPRTSGATGASRNPSEWVPTINCCFCLYIPHIL